MTGDSRELLRTLPGESVNCCITSPPYFGLRDYGVVGQMGLEETPEDFVAGMVAVFDEVRRVLRSDGTLWLNIGDSYAGNGGQSPQSGALFKGRARQRENVCQSQRGTYGDAKAKDLIGIPWMLAFALRAAGWYLRQDIIWSKPNPMPESVTDRCTKSHEYLFLLSKSPRYYFDADAIAEPVADTSLARWRQPKIASQAGSDRVPGKTNGAMKAVGGIERPQAKRAIELAREGGLTDAHIAAIRSVGITDSGKARVTQSGCGNNTAEAQRLADEAKEVLGGYYREFLIAESRNKRSVWSVATMPFKGAHFATFPQALVEPCIKAGCPVGGTVLDPFFGAGTTGLVADRLQRDCIGIELNPEYAQMAARRIADDSPLFNNAIGAA